MANEQHDLSSKLICMPSTVENIFHLGLPFCDVISWYSNVLDSLNTGQTGDVGEIFSYMTTALIGVQIAMNISVDFYVRFESSSELRKTLASRVQSCLGI